MGLLRTLLLGDIGNWMDNEDTRKEMRRKRRLQRNRQANRDRKQDERLASLEEELDSLRVGVAALATTLRDRGILSPEQIEAIVAAEEEDEREP